MRLLLKLIIFALFLNNIYSQSNVNPDISLIGSFSAFTNNVKETHEYGKLNFENPSMEAYIEGYLNPYSKASAIMAYHEGEFHLEEIYAQIFRGLPLDMQLKAGKYLVGFGKINAIHPHAWPFIYRPLFHQVFFGEEGFNDIGVNASFILPIESFYTAFDLGIFKGSASKLEHSHDDGPLEENIVETSTSKPFNSPIIVGRLTSFFELNEYSNLEFGISGSYGVHSKLDVHILNINPFDDTGRVHQATALKYFWGGIDFKYKYKPDSYTALTIQAEGLLNHRDVFIPGSYIDKLGKINSFGGFFFIDYLFQKQFSIGAKYDFTYGIADDEASFNTLANDEKNKTHGISGWFGYYPIEETLAVRLGVQHLWFNYSDDTIRDNETTIALQMLFSLGPHKAHPF